MKINKKNFILHTIDDGWKDVTIVGIEVNDSRDAVEIIEQTLKDKKLRTDLKKYRKSLDDIEDHDEVNLKDDLDRIMEGKKPL